MFPSLPAKTEKEIERERGAARRQGEREAGLAAQQPRVAGLRFFVKVISINKDVGSGLVGGLLKGAVSIDAGAI